MKKKAKIYNKYTLMNKILLQHQTADLQTDLSKIKDSLVCNKVGRKVCLTVPRSAQIQMTSQYWFSYR